MEADRLLKAYEEACKATSADEASAMHIKLVSFMELLQEIDEEQHTNVGAEVK